MSESNSVFISYRRSASADLTLKVCLDLQGNGINVFYDITSIGAGKFDEKILSEIAARPYFVLVLAPGTLERCSRRTDWVRREITHALKLNRVIVPLCAPEFDLGNIDKYLPKAMAKQLRGFEGVRIPSDPYHFTLVMNDVRARFLKPIDLLVGGKQLTAQEYFERALARPEMDVDGKIADWSEAIRISPRYAKAYYNRGVTHDIRGDLDDAIADYTEAIRFNPQYADAYYNRGHARRDKGDLDDAIADWSEAIRLNPQREDAYNNRGAARSDQGDLDGAIADCTEAIRLNPRLAAAYNNRGAAYGDKGDLDKAIADYTEAIRLNPQYADAYNNRGYVHATRDDWDQATVDFDEAIRLNPQSATAYYNRALLRADKAGFKGAIADGQKALALGIRQPFEEEMRKNIAKWRKLL